MYHLNNLIQVQVNGGKCSICFQERSGTSCGQHFFCAKCFRVKSGLNTGESPLVCPIQGCTNCFSKDQLRETLPVEVYQQYVANVAAQERYAKALETAYQDKFSDRIVKLLLGQLLPEIAKIYDGVENIERSIGLVANDIRNLHGKMDKSLAGLSFLVKGEQMPCPNVIWIGKIAPRSNNSRSLKTWFQNLVEDEVEVYFLSEDDYSLGHTQPMKMHFKRQCVKEILPVIKVSVLAVKFAGVLSGLPLPLPGSGDLERYLDSVNDLCANVIEDSDMGSLLEDLETWYEGMVAGDGSVALHPNRIRSIQKLVGDAYVEFSKRALKPKHALCWQHPHMEVKVLDRQLENGRQIVWVKRRSCLLDV